MAGFITRASLNCRRHYRLPPPVRHLCPSVRESAGECSVGVRRCAGVVCQQGDQARETSPRRAAISSRKLMRDRRSSWKSSLSANATETFSPLPFVSRARIVCVAESIKQNGVRPSVRLSVCLSQHEPTAANPLLQVCCCGPGGQEISIDWCSSGGRIEAVPRCQRT